MKKATIYNFSRLCRAQKNKCENCPMSADNNGADKFCLTLVTKYPDKANEIILKWCKEHPDNVIREMNPTRGRPLG